jgi:cyanophycinase
MEAVDRTLLERLGKPARVVCLPTAAGQEGAERIRYWMGLGEAHFHGLGAQVEALPVTNRVEACEARWAERIAGANFVYLSGGRPGYLYRTLVDTPVWQAILGIYRQGGVLAGCSAGAMILGERIAGFPRGQAGFGLLPGTMIAPHFDELSPRAVRLMRHFVPKEVALIGIDGNTALVVESPGWTVTGSGGVTVIGQGGRESSRYRQGDSIDQPTMMI